MHLFPTLYSLFVIFVLSGEEGLSLEEIANLIEKDKKETSEIIKELYNDYDNNDRGMHIEFLGNKFKFTTSERTI